ncbi:MAG TPA: TPM domain-containing protein [Acidobacteriota bacterium]|nr:TPM domain-containing protein [Acidobacteriota bacterium]
MVSKNNINCITVLAMYAVFFLFCLSTSVAFDTSQLDKSAYVNDLADLYSAQEEYVLTDFLSTLSKNYTYEFAVVTVPSLDEDIFDASFQSAEYLGLGRSDVDNGLLLFISRDDRSYFVQIGKGLEGAIPDITVNQVAQSTLIPAFQNGEYAQGTFETLAVFARLAIGDPDTVSKFSEAKQVNYAAIIILIIIVIIVILSIKKSSRRGGGFVPVFYGGNRGFGGSGGNSHSFGGGRFGGGGSGGKW